MTFWAIGRWRKSLQLEELKGQYSGRIFIFGTGQSLIEQLPLLRQMEHEVTFCCNRIHQWKDLPFTPTFFSCEYHALDRVSPVPSCDEIRFLIYRSKEVYIDDGNWVHVSKQKKRIGCFDNDPEYVCAALGTSVGVDAQLAAWMGYDPIYLLGLDHAPNTGYCFRPEARRTFLFGDKVSEQWDNLKTAFYEAGRHIYDCTPMGGLNQNGPLEYRVLGGVLGVS
jgi:hypothetical protein